MEIITGTTRTHQDHGQVDIESIYREFASYDTADGTGHIHGAWYVRYTPCDGSEARIELLSEFIDALSR